jgi:Holliday junction resolvase RusA-like endonuclease
MGIVLFPVFTDKQTTETTSYGLELDVCFYFGHIRADYHRVDGAMVLKDVHQLHPTKKDIDNLIKFVMNVMHSVVYSNDKSVVYVIASKKFILNAEFDSIPYTTIRIAIIET